MTINNFIYQSKIDNVNLFKVKLWNIQFLSAITSISRVIPRHFISCSALQAVIDSKNFILCFIVNSENIRCIRFWKNQEFRKSMKSNMSYILYTK